jgi:hypothetical protein
LGRPKWGGQSGPDAGTAKRCSRQQATASPLRAGWWAPAWRDEAGRELVDQTRISLRRSWLHLVHDRLTDPGGTFGSAPFTAGSHRPCRPELQVRRGRIGRRQVLIARSFRLELQQARPQCSSPPHPRIPGLMHRSLESVRPARGKIQCDREFCLRYRASELAMSKVHLNLSANPSLGADRKQVAAYANEKWHRAKIIAG